MIKEEILKVKEFWEEKKRINNSELLKKVSYNGAYREIFFKGLRTKDECIRQFLVSIDYLLEQLEKPG